MLLLPLAFVVLVLLYFSTANSQFTTSRNMENMLHQAAIIGFVAVGIAAVMYYAKIDLSSLGLFTVAVLIFIDVTNANSVFVGFVVTVLLAMGIGLINGMLVARLKTQGALLTLMLGLSAGGLFGACA